MATLPRAVLGTAGHIDHGKTSLVRALTNIDTDPLAEEKARGISITLGFAYLDLADGSRIGLVDVPGHERFIRMMLAGVSGIDAICLCIAADDSVMPQTREHFDICRLLDVRHGLVAITKCDLVDDEMLELVEAEVEELVAGTFLEGAPVVRCSATTGVGLDDLRARIVETLDKIPPRQRAGAFRLPVDRVFTRAGHGTVVTGTLIEGTARVGEPVMVYPSGREGRIRGLQAHGQAVETVHAGSRTAINLSGVKLDEVERGDVVAAPNSLAPSRIIDASLRMLGHAFRGVAYGSRVRLYTGTRETYGRVYPLEETEIGPGEDGVVQFRLDDPIVVRRGDRFVIRLYGPDITVGGGSILEPQAVEHRRRRERQEAARDLTAIQSGRPTDILAVALRDAPFARTAAQLTAETKLPEGELADALGIIEAEGEAVCLDRGTAPLWWHRERVSDAVDTLAQMAKTQHDESPFSRLGLPVHAARQRLADALGEAVGRAAFEGLVRAGEAMGVLAAREGTVALASVTVRLKPDQQKAWDTIATAYAQAGPQPPNQDDALAGLPVKAKVARQLYRGLVDDRVLIEVAPGFAFHRDAYETIRGQVREWFEEHAGAGMTVSTLREVVGTTRKYAVPLFEHFDAIGLTKRQGDERVWVGADEPAGPATAG